MIKKILVPLDGSDLAEKALPYAEELARKFDAELTLLWVLQPMVVMSDYGSHSYDNLIGEEPEKAKSYLTDLRQRLLERDLKVQSAVVDSQPAADKIIDIAEQDRMDVIVMCTHGRSGIDCWIFGSVANKVLQHAPCPVYLIRAKEAEAA